MQLIQTVSMKKLKKHKQLLSPQAYRTLKGQILSGDAEGAMKGMRKLIDEQKERAI